VPRFFDPRQLFRSLSLSLVRRRRCWRTSRNQIPGNTPRTHCSQPPNYAV